MTESPLPPPHDAIYDFIQEAEHNLTEAFRLVKDHSQRVMYLALANVVVAFINFAVILYVAWHHR
jgi:hypothetical protein